MPTMEEKLFIESAKPAVGFVEALLKPKIEKLEAWAREKNLEKDLEPDRLSKSIESYLTKLSSKSSEITSMAFPQHKLNISDAYEPLHIHERGLNEALNQDVQISRIIESNKDSFIIVDHAGMGKSTFSKYLVSKILFKSKRIPILFELRRINQDIPLIDNLAKELDLPGEEFSREIFYKLLKLGYFILILDGFDEVPIDHQAELATQIHELSSKIDDNTIILTSRPQDTLPDLVKGISLEFKKFTSEQAISLISRYDRVSGLKIGDRLSQELGNVPPKFLETPLLVSLLYKSFGVNNAISERISTFYEDVYHAIYKGHDLINKNGFGREKKSGLDFEEFRRLLRNLCYQMMVKRKVSFDSWSEATSYIEQASKSSSIIPSSATRFLDDLLVSVPLMVKEGTDYKFIHKTIIEYFAAEHLINSTRSNELLRKISAAKIGPSFTKTFEFIAEINPQLFEREITKPFAEKVQNIKPSKDLYINFARTLAFTKECQVGIFSFEEHADDPTDVHSPTLSDSLMESTEHYQITYDKFFMDEEFYFICISHSGFMKGLHPNSWINLTDSIHESSIDTIEEPEELEALSDLIGINEWAPLTTELIDTLESEKIRFLLPAHVLNIPNGLVSAEKRILSSKKASSLIERIESEIVAEREINDLIE